ncbi:TonB-dependent receptor [Gallaecimonas mangrovi]|uniref:TonB-dependent receptor n=1 Tax=Gallaecimonas mangrovi TaxID=2291597 RepID=UPI001D014EF6|nr:TonB-dependent siderophore receptor [Gallaecimonas mangrovi]
MSRIPAMKYLPLALAVQLALAGVAVAADNSNQTSTAAASKKATDNKDKNIETITVTASADASRDGLIGAFAGGQVAKGQRAGLLGTTDYMDSPFSGTAYTNKFITDIQAEGVGDVLEHDPGVRVARGFGNFQESYFIRGFLLYSDEMSYNGLYGVLPRQYVSSEIIQRVEVLRGASTFLNGMSPSGNAIGGSVNLVPKRASNDNKTDITLGFNDQGQGYGAADISRRFGDNDSQGIRVNVAHREGDTDVDGESVNTDVGSVGYDWRGDKARVSAGLTFQDRKLKDGRPSITLSGVTSVPALPDVDANYGQDWTHSDERDLFGTLRAEYDLSDNVTAWAAVGARHSNEDNSLANITLTDSQTGDGYTYRADNVRVDDVFSAEVGIRGSNSFGGVSNKWALAGDYYNMTSKNAYAWGDYTGTYTTNIYHPTQYAKPSNDFFGAGDMSSPGKTGSTELPSLALSDTLGFMDDSLLVTLGARYQDMEVRNYAYGTGIQSSKYDDSRVSPSAGVVYKLTDWASLYANYIEALAQGDSASSTAVNAGEQLSPYVSKQKEVGAKFDGGNIGATLAYFTTDKPSGYVNDQNVFGAYGKDKHQGVEVTFFGEPLDGVSVLGGVTYLDAKQKDTADGATDGNWVIGTAKWQGNLGVTWQLPWVYGLSLDAQAVSTGSRYADAANTLQVAGWTRFDMGAKYSTTLLNHDVTINARIQNLTDKNYWSSVGGYPGQGYLVQGAPRSVNVEARFSF